MGIAFGLFVLVIVIVALYNRRRENKVWRNEERYEESGNWIDKRSGERGTYGRLDALQEAERHALSQQGRVNDLMLDIRNYLFEHLPDFHTLSNDQLKAHTAFGREQIARLLPAIEALKKGRAPESAVAAQQDNPHRKAIQKLLLNFAYKQAPELLELDLSLIQAFDAFTGVLADALLEKADALKQGR